MKAVAKRTIKLSKTNSWIKYLGSLNYSIPLGELWKKIKFIGGHNYTPIMSLMEENKLINNQEEIANILAANFANNSDDSNHNQELLDHKKETEVNEINYHNIQDNYNNPINRNFTLNELTAVLTYSKNTSPGPDGIPNRLLRQLPKKALITLLNIFNIIWTNSRFSYKGGKWNFRTYLGFTSAVMLRTSRVPFSSRVRNSIFLYPRAKVRSLIFSEKS